MQSSADVDWKFKRSLQLCYSRPSWTFGKILTFGGKWAVRGGWFGGFGECFHQTAPLRSLSSSALAPRNLLRIHLHLHFQWFCFSWAIGQVKSNVHPNDHTAAVSLICKDARLTHKRAVNFVPCMPEHYSFTHNYLCAICVKLATVQEDQLHRCRVAQW